MNAREALYKKLKENGMEPSSVFYGRGRYRGWHFTQAGDSKQLIQPTITYLGKNIKEAMKYASLTNILEMRREPMPLPSFTAVGDVDKNTYSVEE